MSQVSIRIKSMESNEILATSELSDNESENFYDALDAPAAEKPERKDSKTEADAKKSLEGVIMDSSDTDEEISNLKRDESESVNEAAGGEAEEKEHEVLLF